MSLLILLQLPGGCGTDAAGHLASEIIVYNYNQKAVFMTAHTHTHTHTHIYIYIYI